MTSRLDQRFASLKRDGRSALVAYVMAMLTALAGFSGVAFAQQPRTVIAASVLDIAVLDGSHIPSECPPIDLMKRNTTVAGCVAFSIRDNYRGVSWDNAYATALRRHGWNLWSGAGMEYWFERSTEDRNCSDRVDLVFSEAPTAEELIALRAGEIEYDDIAGGLIYFITYQQPTCGDDRYWLRTRQ